MDDELEPDLAGGHHDDDDPRLQLARQLASLRSSLGRNARWPGPRRATLKAAADAHDEGDVHVHGTEPQGGTVQYESEDDPAPPPGMPKGRFIDLAGRGTTWAYDTGAPHPSAPTVLLLHGWTATAGLNWFSSIPKLARHHRVIALDHRGHGRGIRSWRRFRLEDCADDAIALADWLGVDRVIPVGYSMGGPIAQLVWKRHADRVDGLVLCATSRNFRGSPAEKAVFGVLTGLSVAARVAPSGWRTSVNERVMARKLDDTEVGRWARSEVVRNDARMVAEAGHAIGSFSSKDWIGGVDAPTAVVVTEYDSVVPSYRQRRLAESIPGATEHPVLGDHGVCAMDPAAFVTPLLDAVADVAARAAARNRAAG